MKKKSLILIMGIIVIIAIIGVTILFLTLSRRGIEKPEGNREENKEESKLENSSKNNIVQIYMSGSRVVVLTEDGNMYAIGENDFGGLGNKGDLDDITLIASDVKNFTFGGDFYIDNNDDLYISGIDGVKGGIYQSYEKMAENVKKVSGNELGFMVLSKDGELFAYGGKNYSGIGEECLELTKVEEAKNVVDVFCGLSATYYENEQGELFIKETMSNSSFRKVFDVKKTASTTIQTKNNEIYTLNYSDWKVTTNLEKDANGFMETADGTVYLTKDGKLINSTKNEGYIKNYPSDVKRMLFIDTVGFSYTSNYIGYLFVYLNSENKIVLHIVKCKGEDKVDDKVQVLDYTVKNMKDVYEFINKKGEEFITK